MNRKNGSWILSVIGIVLVAAIVAVAPLAHAQG